MILHFPCLKRMDHNDVRNGPNHTHPFQSRLSTFGVGISFSDMVNFQVDQFTRNELALDADISWVDQSYPGSRDQVSA
ncbi:MAG: hypothetical protein M0Q91_16460 [Methanoregula sp.]|jgi:hypothetical protein|nr:hypothetical protein [Methanoregula sp.]